MGCPAKKVCNAWADPLMRDESLVARILRQCHSVDVPVTLKITSWAADQLNTRHRAHRGSRHRRAAVHGRTPDQQYTGFASTTRSRRSVTAFDPRGRQRRHRLATEGCAVLTRAGVDADGWTRHRDGHGSSRDRAPPATGEILAEPSLQEVRDISFPPEHLHAFPATCRRAHRTQASWLVCKGSSENARSFSGERGETADTQLRLTRDYFDALVAGVRIPRGCMKKFLAAFQLFSQPAW
jgi:tRNA-dihydrouridine synthase B